MKTLESCIPRKQVLDGTADFVVNLSMLPGIELEEAEEFLDSNVLTSGMDALIRSEPDNSCDHQAIALLTYIEQ